MRKMHPEVEVCIGTLNTNRLEYVSQFINGLKDKVKVCSFRKEKPQHDALSTLHAHYRAERSARG